MAGFLGTISGQVRLDTRQAVAAYAALRAQNAKTVYALRGTGDSFIAAGKVMTVAGAGMVYMFGRAVSAAAEFERKMDFFGAVSDTSAAQMDKLGDHTLKLAEDTIYSANEIADGFIELGKAGVNAQMIMDGIGQAMANLGAAGDIPLAESGQVITSTIQQFDLAATDAVKVVDLMAGAANASIADISDIGVSLKYVGGVANAVGLTFEDTATAISLLAKAGIRGSTAGTSLRQMLVSLGGATGPARESLTELGIMTEDGGNKFFTAEGKAKSLSRVFQILQKSTEDLTQKERLMHLRTIFNNRALSAASILTREGAKGFREMNREMSKTSAAEVASERLDNLSGDIEILRGNIETLMIRAGGPFQEFFRGIVQDITRLVQAFDELDPAMQRNIVASVGIGGAALILMGIFSLVVGTIFRFLHNIIRLGAAFKFIGKLALLAGKAIWWAFKALTPVGKAIAIVLALGQAIYELYQRSETFRNGVNRMGAAFMAEVVNPVKSGIDSLIQWFQKLGDSPSQVWNNITDGAQRMWTSVVGFFRGIGSAISGAFTGAVSSIGAFISGVVGWFQQLPGRVMGIVSGFVSRVTELLTFRNIGFAIGFMVGTVVRLFLGMAMKVGQLAAQMVAGVIRWFQLLPGRVASFVSMMAARAVALWSAFRARVSALAAAIVTAVVSFFTQLPGRVAAFVASMVARAVSLFNTMRTQLPALAAAAVNAVLSFISTLPGRVAAFIGSMVARARSGFQSMVSAAASAGAGIYNGIVGGIQGIPGAIAGVISNMLGQLKGAVGSAISAAQELGAGLWSGFKAGIGMNSPSYIEKAMWQITGTVDKEAKKLADQTMQVQAISKRMAATKFSVKGTSGTSGYAKLARDTQINRNRARTLLTASSTRPSPDDRRASGRPTDRLVRGELDLTPSGRAFIRGVAQETYDDSDYFNEFTDGMN